MLFSSITFISIFLPLVCFLYLCVKKDLKNYVLLIASIIFYAWGEPRYLAIMLLTILINYIGANYISRSKKQPHRKWLVAITILADLSFLIYFKYFNFIIDNINTLTNGQITPINIIMPIGISFYTFQAISYVIDVYRGEVQAQKDIYKLALYITLFPQLIAGPIVKYHDIEQQINDRNSSIANVIYGVKRFILGLSKKILLANTLGAVADQIFSQPVNAFDTITAWVGAIAYSLQLYYDFSGYSDMAIGLGSIFGFKFLENFNYPYISKSISEFWRRWHISLSTWFKEYLYIPLGGNRVSKSRNVFNLFVVFLATGIWHGASWNFIFWGLWHGAFIILEKLTGLHKVTSGKICSILQHIYTIFIFVIGWVMFRAENMEYAWNYIKNMFGMMNEHIIVYQLSYYISTLEILVFIVSLVICAPIFQQFLTKGNKNKLTLYTIDIWLLLLFIISLASIAASTYNPFIYFRF